MSVTEPMPSQRGHMPPMRLKLAFTVLRLPRSTVIPPFARTVGTLKANALGEPMGGLPRRRERGADPGEGDAQPGGRVGGGAPRGARVGPDPLLVDDDRGRQPCEHVDLGPG